MIMQRIFASVLLLACAILAVMAWPYQAAYSYEPVGPRAYPLLMLGLLALASLYMLIRPAPIALKEDEQPLDAPTLKKIGACILLLLIFAGLFEPAGFIIASIVIGIPMGRLYGGRWVPSIVCAVVMSIGLYLLFDKVMDVPLPLGLLSVLEN